MNTITLTPEEEEIASFLKQYQAYLKPSKNAYIRYFFKFEQATVSVYTSGKVLFQGEKAANYAETFASVTSLQEKKEGNTSQSLSLIGTDEVGNGSYFGGLAVVASFVQPGQHKFLRKLGVGDSKKLTDQKIRQIAPPLKENIPHQALLLSPKKYNQAITSGYNAVSVKVALHNQAIYLLLQSGITPQKIVIDAFTSNQNYQKYLKQEKNHFSQPVMLEEKAEDKYLAVAVSSIIARELFLENLDSLGQTIGYRLPSGAGAKSDEIASQILKTHGLEGLDYSAKLHFKNTEKAKQLLER